jgi:hypothetical protein
MKIYVLFAQRKCRYNGEYAPEALEVIDAFGMDENPEFLRLKQKEYENTKEFDSVVIIPIAVSNADIDSRLGLNQPPVIGLIK